MKIHHIILVALLGISQACHRASDPPAFLPGIYVSRAENEFCRIVDTLIIRKKGEGDAGYEVTRRSSFTRIREGKAMTPEYQEDIWAAGYDAANAVLLSPGKTREIRYAAGDNKVVKGEWEYEKVE